MQFEDIANERAVALLEKYRHHRLCFNDDIQGTGATCVAGLLCALRRMGKNTSDICKQRFVVVGAGSAGIGVADSIVASMVKAGMAEEDARTQFYFVDDKGLLTARRAHSPESLLPGQAKFLQADADKEGASLLETIRLVKPTALLGLSGVSGLFSEEICAEMGSLNEHPIIFPMSNPISKAECTAETAFTATQGRAIVASGSPFDDVTLSDGTVCRPSQANNMYSIFPYPLDSSYFIE